MSNSGLTFGGERASLQKLGSQIDSLCLHWTRVPDSGTQLTSSCVLIQTIIIAFTYSDDLSLDGVELTV